MIFISAEDIFRKNNDGVIAMSDEELISRGIECLIENLGYVEAGEFLRQIAQNDEEILAGAIKYSEMHNLK